MLAQRHRHVQRRKGVSVVFAVLCLVALVSISALAVDIGYMYNARAELQRSADAAALAACWEMGRQYAIGTPDVTVPVMNVATSAAAANDICNQHPTIDSSDVQIGYLDDLSDRNLTLDTSDPTDFNSVTVRVRRNSSINGRVGTFMAKAFGIDGINASASSTAVIMNDIKGFQTPNDGSNLNILPIALDLATWTNLVSGAGSDMYAWDSNTNQVTIGADSILECNLYPQGAGMTRHRGTVDIGGSNNNTAVIISQIRDGLTASDLAATGGKLELDFSGEITLFGELGISNAARTQLAASVGKTKIIPIFSTVQGSSDFAQFTVVKWCGVRIMDVKLTGPHSQKRVMIQPAPVASPGIIPTVNGAGTSQYVYSRVYLIR